MIRNFLMLVKSLIATFEEIAARFYPLVYIIFFREELCFHASISVQCSGATICPRNFLGRLLILFLFLRHLSTFKDFNYY